MPARPASNSRPLQLPVVGDLGQLLLVGPVVAEHAPPRGSASAGSRLARIHVRARSRKLVTSSTSSVLMPHLRRSLVRLDRDADPLRCSAGVPYRGAVDVTRRRKKWMSCSKVRPIPPWIWTQSCTQLRAVVADEGLGRTDQLAGVGRSGGHGRGGRVADGVRGLEPGLHVGEPVLELLVGGERSPERIAVERPLDGHVQRALHGADRLRVGNDQRHAAAVARLASSASPISPTTVRRARRTSSKVTSEKRRVRSTVCIGRDRDALGAGRDEHLGEPAAGASGHQKWSGLLRPTRPGA